MLVELTNNDLDPVEGISIDNRNAAEEYKGFLEDKIATLLSSVPRGVSVHQTSKANELEVGWESVESVESSRHPDKKWRIILHKMEICVAEQVPPSLLLYDAGKKPSL